MGYLRRMIPWVCAAVLVLSGAVGRGVVLCVDSDGSAHLELADDTGRCVDGELDFSTSGRLECSRLTAATAHCLGCEDVSLDTDSVRLTAVSPEVNLSLPPLVTAFLIPRHDTSAEFTSRVPRPLSSPPVSLSSDVYAVRKTVALLI
jgi:hypothetical protein